MGMLMDIVNIILLTAYMQVISNHEQLKVIIVVVPVWEKQSQVQIVFFPTCRPDVTLLRCDYSGRTKST